MNGARVSAFAILAVWGVLYLNTIFRESFSAPAEVMPLALAAASYLFTAPVVKALRNGRNGNDE